MDKRLIRLVELQRMKIKAADDVINADYKTYNAKMDIHKQICHEIRETLYSLKGF